MCVLRQVARLNFDPERIVGYSEVIQFDGLSPFRPCGRDLVEFFDSTVWALYVQVHYFRFAFIGNRWDGGHFCLAP